MKNFTYFQGKSIAKQSSKRLESNITKRKVFKNGLWQEATLYSNLNINFVVSKKNGLYMSNKSFDALSIESQKKVVEESEDVKDDDCIICGLSDDYTPMVECTSCNKWAHCRCLNVKVKDVEKNENFKCTICVLLKF